jgi:hypothetical protein
MATPLASSRAKAVVASTSATRRMFLLPSFPQALPIGAFAHKVTKLCGWRYYFREFIFQKLFGNSG